MAPLDTHTCDIMYNINLLKPFDSVLFDTTITNDDAEKTVSDICNTSPSFGERIVY